MKYFVTSDTHSFFDEMLEAIHSKGFEENNPDHKLVICGDVFDRGDQSVEIYEYLKGLEDQFIYIKGNHEDLLMDCVRDIASGHTIGSHHFHNKTIKTIADFCGMQEGELLWPRRSDSTNQLVYDKMKPVMEWINIKSVDYAEVGNNIFVHGWIPIVGDGVDFMGNWKNPKPAPREWWDNGNEELWNEARWANGMALWKQGVKIHGKTIYMGHFHSSYGHSHIHQNRKEFPDKNRKDWKKSFEPFIDEGIVAIDSCCAYSGFLNCIVLEA